MSCPERFVAEGLVEALADVPVARALVARAAEARDVLPDALRERGAEVDVVALYETVAEPLSDAQLEALGDADYVTFTSSSTVRFLFEAIAGRVALRARLVSIGPVTSETLREQGHEPDVEAVRHDIDGVVDALVADVAGCRAGLSSRIAPNSTALREPRSRPGWRARPALHRRARQAGAVFPDGEHLGQT